MVHADQSINKLENPRGGSRCTDTRTAGIRVCLETTGGVCRIGIDKTDNSWQRYHSQA